MSIKLFYENPYLDKWTAVIKSIDQKDEKYLIPLDMT